MGVTEPGGDTMRRFEVTMAKRWRRARPVRGVDGVTVYRRPRPRDESGATLVLALLFLVVVGTIVGAMASWTANSLTDEVVFQNARSAQAALNSATQIAIQNIRYTPLMSPNSTLGTDETLNASPPEYCWGTGPGSVQSFPQDQNYTVAVWCSTALNPSSSTTRTVTISACLLPSGASVNYVTMSNWQSLSSSCATTPGLQTVVAFDDYQANNTTSPEPCTTTCGAGGMLINSSSLGTTIPSVTSLSPSSGPVTGGTAVTITGTGFVSGSTSVSFIHPVASANVVSTIPPGSVTFTSSTSISVTTPIMTTAATYYVVVATPNGTSLYGPQFTFQPVSPTMRSLSPTTGSASGGTAITITGTGFLSSAAGDRTVVTFTDTANSAVTVTSPNISVSADGKTITATAPAITRDSVYYVTVTTFPTGVSTPTSSSYEFTFQPYYPVAASISPNTGNSGTVSIQGFGFLSGATTVQLIPSGGFGVGNLTLTNVTVTSPTQLTATIPSGGNHGTTYYVSVTTTWNGTQYQSCNANGSGNVPSCSGEGAPTYQYT